MRKLLEAILETMETGVPVHLNDEYGSYQLAIARQSDEIAICDSFGGGSVRLPYNEMVTELRQSFDESTGQLECVIPQMATNETYQQLKSEVDEMIQMVTR